MYEILIPIQPVPAARPRVSKWGTYYPKNYTNFLNLTKETLSHNIPTPLTGFYDVEMEFSFIKAKSSKLQTPTGDIDNLCKGPLDVITHLGLWDDDKNVVKLKAHKYFGDKPFIKIKIKCIQAQEK